MPQKPGLCVAFRSRETECAQTDSDLRRGGGAKQSVFVLLPSRSLIPTICSALQIGARRDSSCGHTDIRCMGSCERDSSASEAHEARQTMRYLVPLEVSPVFFPHLSHIRSIRRP